MHSGARLARQILVPLAVALALGAGIPAGTAAAPARGCGSFAAQAEAQAYFVHFGGSPERRVGNLDADRDGVACEGLTGPYAGFATVGYNRKKDFFYGTASMPPDGSGSGEYPCLYGNRHFLHGPRRLNLYRVGPGGDKAIFGVGISTEAKPDTGRLLWRADKANMVPGRYYAAFEERIRVHPYGNNECPGFRSRAVLLP
jgi:hypothetical protein